MLSLLKQRVLEANLLLPKYKLVKFTWGNVSEIDRENEIIAIKPSGVDYNLLTKNDIVIVALDGKVLEGNLLPSSDIMTHIEIYKAFTDINGIVHTHSPYATIWSQAGLDIPALGTTHADYFYGDIPCTRTLTSDEIKNNYEKNTGKVIVEEFAKRNINNQTIPGALVAGHGPFVWGLNALNAVHNAVVLEEIALMAIETRKLNIGIKISEELLDKHYLRKHGKNSYYGQVIAT